MNVAYLLIGGNLGNRFSYLKKAAEYIEQFCGKIITSSSIYETAAWGITEQPAFLNQVIALETGLLPNQLMQKLLWIEQKMGRIRNEKFGPRIIDIDILLIDDIIINTELITVPHQALPNRKFALIPLDEIASTFIHPVEKKSIHQLLLDCADNLNVQKISMPAD